MITSYKKLIAFTLAETAVVFFIMGVVALITINLTTSRMNYVNKFAYYSTFMNLKNGVGQLIAEGCPSTVSVCRELKALPTVGYKSDGTGFCDRLTNIMNTVGSIDCSLSLSSEPTDFSSKPSNFITTNGAIYYNFGKAPVFGEGATYDGTPENDIYTIYVDVSGARGKSILNQDVMKFRITRAGMVLPDPSSVGATNTDYLSTSVKYKDASNNIIWLKNGITFKEAECISGYITTSIYSGYCSPYTQDTTHCPISNNTCKVVINKPGF
ncbi:MAG: hypothetical protein WCY19_06230 [Candidatus Gastranaerophilaceae bacterium]